MATKKSPKKKVDVKNKKLSTERELFCILYTGHHNRDLFGNATRCYLEAFGHNERIESLKNEIVQVRKIKDRGYTTVIADLEADIKSIEASGRSASARLLATASIRAHVDELMDSMISDEFNDREMQYVITQRHDLASKVAAMREYNALKKRIKDAGTQTGPITIHIAPEILAKMQ